MTAESVFVLKPPRAAGTVDTAEVRRALSVLADPAAGCFVQGLPWAHWECLPGKDLDGLVKAVERIAGAEGTYFGLNPCRVGIENKPRVADIVSRRWMLVDCDFGLHAEKLNATDDEREAVRAVALAAADYLSERGWVPPVMVDSGNGFHLLYRIDMPNTKLSRELIKAVLEGLANKFDSEAVGIGSECCDAPRISKLPGTLAARAPETKGRPHRMARLLFVPEFIEVNHTELVQATAMEFQPRAALNGHATEKPTEQTWTKLPSVFLLQHNSLRAYARQALENEAAAVRLAPMKTRNIRVNKAGFSLGGFVPHGLLLEQQIVTRLWEEAIRNGVGTDEPDKTRETLIRAVRDGKANPRVLPKSKAEAKKDEPPPVGEGVALTMCAAAITPQRVEWLWPDRVPKRFITVLAGRTGLGKSFVMLDMVARLTVGGEIPFRNGECFDQGSALIISEDPPEYMLVPRLMEMGADLDRVRFMNWEAMMQYTIHDVELLNRAFREVPGCRVVIIDPPTNFLGDTDEHKNAEVRSMLMRLVIWAKDQDLACVLIMHVNKQTGKGIEAINRVMGSVAWVSTSRIAHSFTPDPDDPKRCLFLPMKNNLGPIPLGLMYRVVATPNLAKVEWLAEVDTTADDAMSRDPGKPRRIVAAEWLAEQLQKRNEWPSDELFAAARAENVSRDAIFEAKRILRLPRARRQIEKNGDTTYFWWVPPGWVPPIGADRTDVATVATVEEKNDAEAF